MSNNRSRSAISSLRNERKNSKIEKMSEAKQAALEALLFYHGEPISYERIGKILGLDRQEIMTLAEATNEQKTASESGLMLIEHNDALQLVTKPEHRAIFDALAKEDLNEELTPATLETLAIIGYLGPISRTDIEYLRGVNSTFTLRNLYLRGLIERAQKKNTYTYSISVTALAHLGLKNQNGLPDYENYREVVEKMRTTQAGQQES